MIIKWDNISMLYYSFYALCALLSTLILLFSVHFGSIFAVLLLFCISYVNSMRMEPPSRILILVTFTVAYLLLFSVLSNITTGNISSFGAGGITTTDPFIEYIAENRYTFDGKIRLAKVLATAISIYTFGEIIRIFANNNIEDK